MQWVDVYIWNSCSISDSDDAEHSFARLPALLRNKWNFVTWLDMMCFSLTDLARRLNEEAPADEAEQAHLSVHSWQLCKERKSQKCVC